METRSRAAGSAAEDLESWYQKYLATDGSFIHRNSSVIRALDSDVLDDAQIETQVQKLASRAVVINGFCLECQHLLDHWPLLPGKLDTAIGRRFYTYELEAAARKGCQFCVFLYSRLEDDHHTFRKIEARLRDVGDDGTLLLSIQNWIISRNEATSLQSLWINFPGKTASSCYNPGAKGQFESHTLLPIGR